MHTKILDKYGLDIKDLDEAELATLNSWADQLKTKVVSTNDIIEHIESMRYSVELALIKEPEFTNIFIFKVQNRQHILLKARLNNYLVLEAFLAGPGKARKAVQRYVDSIKVDK